MDYFYTRKKTDKNNRGNDFIFEIFSSPIKGNYIYDIKIIDLVSDRISSVD